MIKKGPISVKIVSEFNIAGNIPGVTYKNRSYKCKSNHFLHILNVQKDNVLMEVDLIYGNIRIHI